MIIEVSQGKLRGKVNIDYLGGQYYSFQGIPYAKPPIGDLRFKAPVPPEPWKGIKDATKEANESLSKHLATQKPTGSEDCLYLNIYTSKLHAGSPLPVMVFFHGGVFVRGSSKVEFHGPDYLVTGDVILVTVNYRLGILGFLSLEDPTLGVPGNAGLKDIVQSLRWIQANIHHFNGDPSNVTIFGQSAGATAVHLLMLSPMGKGLFHRAIMQSGCALNPWAVGKRNAKEIAAVLGLISDDEKEILQFLSDLPEERFLEAQDKIKDGMTPDLHRPYGPVIENPSNGPAFLSEHPVDIMLSGNYNKVPLMLGYTSREGMLSEIYLKKEHGSLKMFTDFETKIPHLYNLQKGSDLSFRIAKMIKEFYYGDETPTLENLDKFYLLSTDALFLRGIYTTMNHMVKTMDYPMYFYRISADTELNYFKKVGGIKLPGCCHVDDLGYLFKNKNSPEINPSTLEAKLVYTMVMLWTTFAKDGNPNPSPDSCMSLIKIDWKAIQPNEYHCLDIGDPLNTDTNFDLERMKVWDEIEELAEY